MKVVLKENRAKMQAVWKIKGTVASNKQQVKI